MKFCSGCSRIWPAAMFSQNRARRDGLADQCKQCAKGASRRYYERRREEVARKARGHTKAQAARLRAIVEDAKDVPCADCGKAWPPYVMDFDHLDGKAKRFNVADVMHWGLGVDTLRAEIAKCEVVCANCHRERTHQRRLAARKAAMVAENDAPAPAAPPPAAEIKLQLALALESA